jgi:hypothetical protein
MTKLAAILLVTVTLTLSVTAPASAEWFADLYSGAVFWVNPSIHVDVGNGSISGNRGKSVADFTVGGRFGYWLRPVPWLGFALDTSYYQLHAEAKSANTPLQEAKLQIVPITPLVMARLPLLESSEYPAGRLQPYVGAGPGIFWHRRKFDLQSGDRVSDDTVDIGADVRAGAVWSFTPHWGIFAEYRFNYFTTSADRDIETVEIHAHADLHIHSALAGVRFSWG